MVDQTSNYAEFIQMKYIESYIQNQLGNGSEEPFVTVFSIEDDFGKEQSEQTNFYSALISEQKYDQILDTWEWDLTFDNTGPSLVKYRKRSGEWKHIYQRLPVEGIEPLVHRRTFSEKRQNYLEVSEELRLFFNLYEEKDDNERKLLYFNEDGEEEHVGTIGTKEVKLKLSLLKDFLTAKGMYLAIYFTFYHFVYQSLETLGVQEDYDIKGGVSEGHRYRKCITQYSEPSAENLISQGRITGKKLIEGRGLDQIENIRGQGKREKRNYEKFIVGTDQNGDEKEMSCNLSDETYFTTYVFFKREVLKKYLDSSDTYHVTDSMIKRKGGWFLPIQNNIESNVMVFLGDLQDLPEYEQSHWKSFNIPPHDQEVSDVDIARNLRAEFRSSENREMVFRRKLQELRECWQRRYDGEFLKSPSEDDKYRENSLHIPTSGEQNEFDTQVENLHVILIEGINVKQLKKLLPKEKKNSEDKSITVLDKFLEEHDIHRREQIIQFLRDLHDLRSQYVSHRKTRKEVPEVAKKWGIGKEEYSTIFTEMLDEGIEFLDTLKNNFCE